MSESGTARRDSASFLTRNGWAPDRGGPIGELWRLTTETDAPPIAVPYELRTGSPEYQSVVVRVADATDTKPQDVAEAIEREFQDIQQYRIGDRFVVEDSILLESAATVLASARRMVRAAATTARKPRARIGANYSPPGDDLANLMRLSHTRRGSFVLPVVMPVEPPELVDGDILGDKTAVEPGERRVTRTLASAVAALNSIAVQPDHEPGVDDVIHLVQSGVSSELVAAVRAIAVQSGVRAFDIKFQWAPGLQPPGGLPDRVVIPDDAAPVLASVERRLIVSRAEIAESLSGQIVEIRRLPGEPLGEIAIRTIRNNRNVEVRITTTADVIDRAFDWAKQGRAVISYGKIVSTPKGLTIPRPDQLQPLDELFAPGISPVRDYYTWEGEDPPAISM